jgi:ppGpp synthetase/RelA/SpoT-type nucleotidyltranferase
MSKTLADLYGARYKDVLLEIEPELEKLIRNHLSGTPRLDRIVVRAKRPTSFLKKADALDDGGQKKYSDPLVQIQDQLGARVVVFYTSDVDPLSENLKRYFRSIEERAIVPDNEATFGYFGKHYILALPKDAIPSRIDVKSAPSFFELQVKTLFQHAWAEAEHDLGYKAPEQLTSDQKRRLAFTAAQAWGADHMFEDLRAELS